jgi:hypothetical protein
MPGKLGNSDSYDVPDWHMPPRMIGGYVAGPMLVGRTDQVVLYARQVVAYPAGVEVDIEAHAHAGWTASAPAGDEDDRDEDEDEPGRSRYERRSGHRQLNYHVRFGDGRQAALDDEAGLRTGLGPVVSAIQSESSNGGPHGEQVRQRVWIWPLPPPGPFTLTCSWPRRELPESAVVLDGDAIRAAAERALPFWPGSVPTE